MSEIQKFYDGEHIFITGGTGFMGKILVEKLLRSCPGIKIIYMLVRTKKGIKPEDRIKAFLDSPHFFLLQQVDPDYKNKIVALNGNTALPGLGMSAADRELIKTKASIIFHVAAAVKFDEPLAVAVANNVNSVKEIINLCKECERLKVGVYVSTAFSHCHLNTIKEELYPAPLTYKESNLIVRIIEEQNWSEEQITKFEKCVIGKWPNTYSFTKAIAEGIVAEEAKDLPFCVYRPSIALSSYKEPLPGWTDNLLGVNGIVLGVGLGIVHCICINGEGTADLVPIDMACNALIACAWETGIKRVRMEESVPIYNYVSGPQNPITWTKIRKTMLDYAHKKNTNYAVYYQLLYYSKSYPLFLFIDFFLHYIPAVLIDIVLKIWGRKPMLKKIHKKGHKLMVALLFFTRGSWTFENHKIQSLWRDLSETDKAIFGFDMAACNWKDILWTHLDGMRVHILKEELTPQNIEKAARKIKILFVIHQIVRTSFAIFLLWILSKIFCFKLN